MFDPRGDFWKIKINWSNKEWKNGNKKVDICRGGYQILCQRKRRSKIRRKPTFGLVNFCKTRLTDVEIWLYFGRHFQEDIMMFFFSFFIYNIPSNIFQSNWILLIMKSALILALVCASCSTKSWLENREIAKFRSAWIFREGRSIMRLTKRCSTILISGAPKS